MSTGLVHDILNDNKTKTTCENVYTIVTDTRTIQGGPLTYKAQIRAGGNRVNFNRNSPSSFFCRAVQLFNLDYLIKVKNVCN